MLAWPWRVTCGWLNTNTLIRGHDSVLGTHRASAALDSQEPQHERARPRWPVGCQNSGLGR